MTVTCDTLDNLLLEGDPFSMEMASRHAETCTSCAARLATWNEISETARGMRATWKSDMLWPRIERALRNEMRRAPLGAWRIAAALVLLAGLGTFVWITHERTRAAEFDKAILRASALDQVEQAEKAHLVAIDRLEKLAEPKLDDASDPLLVSYKEKLMLLDAAIAECQAGIDQNQRNAHLRRQLLAIYTEKQRTLQDVLRGGKP